ncbi:MAG: class I SAM-dependent methyltransferase [Sphingorhabdus sp.]
MITSFVRYLNRGARQQLPVSDEPSLTDPVSQACTQSQMAEAAYAYWCSQLFEEPKTHRKQWEYCYILQALARGGKIAPGLRGLGFGVGSEPLTALFASRGIEVLATDLEPEQAHQSGWVETAQHASSKKVLNDRGICPPDAFERLVDFAFLDMNKIPPQIRGFDFCWSACALEHLGSIKNGLRFIERSLDCLNPGGIAVHTTEFNCSSDGDTLDNASTVLFRKCDFVGLAKRLRASGHEVVLNFETGGLPLDRHIDLPPYGFENHLKLQIERWVSTSFGFIVRKGA